MSNQEEFTARSIFSQARQQPTTTIDVRGHNLQLSHVSVSGLTRIRRGFLSDLLGPALQARTLGEATDELREAGGRLQALNMARSVRVQLDSSDKNDQITGHLECQESSRYMLRTGVDIGDNEGTGNITAQLNNIWGGGESLQAHYARGTKTRAAFQGILSTPLNANPETRLELTAHQTSMNCRPYGEYDELKRALLLSYRNCPLVPGYAQHEVAYSAAWREIAGLGPLASPGLRGAAGHSLKSSVRYTVTQDGRDSPTVPTSGTLSQISVELAGLGGDVGFVKTHAEAQANQPLPGGYVLSAGLQGGLIWNLRNGQSPLADRFFLGGVTSVRGFEYRGIGPHDGNDSLGGDVFYAAGCSLLTPLPLASTDALKGHLWANAGQNALLDPAHGLMRRRGEVLRFLNSPSAAVGAGLVYSHSMVRVELSLGLPLLATTTDRPKPGLQFGLGLKFL